MGLLHIFSGIWLCFVGVRVLDSMVLKLEEKTFHYICSHFFKSNPIVNHILQISSHGTSTNNASSLGHWSHCITRLLVQAYEGATI